MSVTSPALSAAFCTILLAAAARAEEPVALPPLVVTATATEHSLRDVPASVSVVERAALERRPILDLADALRGEPGLTLTGIGLGRRGVSIRGMPAEQTLILLDGRRINAAGTAIAHADFDLGWIPAEAIERIEVVRGPMSSLYGSDALGGVVNVITRSPTDVWRGSLSGMMGVTERAGAGATYQTGLFLAGPLVQDRLGLSLQLAARGRDALRDARDPRVTSLEEQDALSGSLGLTWTPAEGQRIDANYSHGTEDRWRDILGSGARPVAYGSTDEIRREHIAFSHRGDWGWGSSTLRAYRSRLERTNTRSDGGAVSGPQTLVDEIIDGSLTIPAWGWHRFTLGAELRRERLEDPTVNRRGRDEATHVAGFLQDEIAFSDGLSLTLGSRFDLHEEFGWHASPRAYLVWRATEALTLRGGIGAGFRAPTLKQLSPDYAAVGGGGRFTIVGNENLRPETNLSYEIGAEYATADWQIRATLFQNDLSDLIQTRCTAFCGIRGRERRSYENVEEAWIRGIEIGGALRLPFDLRLEANYTYLDPRDLTNGRELAERPRHSANVALRWAPSDLPVSAGLRANYVGRQVIAETVGAATLHRPLPGYTLWSVDIAWRATEAITLRAGMENISDERLSDSGGAYSTADPGRLYYAGLQVSF